MIFRSKIKIIIHVVLGLLFGLMCGMIYFASTKRFAVMVQDHIAQQVYNDFGLQCSCTLEKIDLFSSTITLCNVSITPLDQGGDVVQKPWSIVSEKLHVTWSLSSLFSSRAIKITMKFDHMIMMELFDQVPEKLAHFFADVFGNMESTWLLYETITIKDGLLYLKRSTDNLYCQVPFNSLVQSDAHRTKIQTQVSDGILWYQNGMSVEKITGSLTLDIPFVDTGNNIQGEMAMNFVMSKSGIKIPGFIAGHMKESTAHLVVKTEDGSVVIDPAIIKVGKNSCLVDLKIKASLDVLKYFDMPDGLLDVGGLVGFEIFFDVFNILKTLQISVMIDELLYKSRVLSPAITFMIDQHSHNSCSGFLCTQNKKLMNFSFKSDQEKNNLVIYNTQPILIEQLGDWQIEPQDFLCDIVFDKQHIIKGTYKGLLRSALYNQQHAIDGTVHIKENNLIFCGTYDNYRYECVIQLDPEFVFKSLQVFDNQNHMVVDFATDEQDSYYLTGSIDFSVIKDLLETSLKSSFAQHGSFIVRGHMKNGILHTVLQTHNADIRVPYVYNVIQNFTATCDIDFYKKNIVFKDVVAEWYEGLMRCSRATFWFDSLYRCRAIHAPLVFDKFMMSWQKGVYGLISGSVLFTQGLVQPNYHLMGRLFLHKAEVRENILSSDFHEALLHVASTSPNVSDILDSVSCDISVILCDGLTVKTSFMSAKAMVELLIQGTLKYPKISGNVAIEQGILQFPYKPIEITSGKILFLPDQPLDPVIELCARGKLKRYTVTLRVSGSALDPHIQFESQPYLSEEQILSLLMLGIEDQSIVLMVPAFLMQKLKDIMFGPALSKTKLKGAFDKILQTLKYVRFLPQFSSQADRGGMRGILEIDATQNLHGKIDMNFAHIEDTKFDVDYSVSDDVTLRLEKDGPSTYGGEVEFRWKFS